MKLNVLLAKTDHLASSFKKSLEDYTKFFKTSQDAFKGLQKTYTPRANTIDSPSDRGVQLIVTTVDEKLKWLEDNSKEYIDALFSQEKTNAIGKATALLVVEGKTWGTFTSLELLKLKSTLEAGGLLAVYENIPVRPDNEQWEKATVEMYATREGVFQSKELGGVKKSVMKESFILPDPNIDKVKNGTYTPQIAQKDTVIDLGDYTFQKFTGEWSHRQRAEVLRRRTILLGAVVEALKVANEAEAVQSDLTSDRIFAYLHRGA
jgi:hypothetical protein